METVSEATVRVLCEGWPSKPGDSDQASGCWGWGVEALLFAPLDTLDIWGWNSACEPLLGREILNFLCQNPTRQLCIWPSEVDKRLTAPRRLYVTTFTCHSARRQLFSPPVLYLWPGPSFHKWQWTAAWRHHTSWILPHPVAHPVFSFPPLIISYGQRHLSSL